MTEPADLSSGPVNPVRALLDITPTSEDHPHRVALLLLAPAWDALDRGETACLAHMEAEPGPRYMAPMADLCNYGCDLVAAAARAVVAGEPRSRVDEHLHRATDLAYLCALARPQLPKAVRPALKAVTTAFAVGHEPDLYTRVLDTLTPQPETPAPDGTGSNGNPDARRFAVAARAVGYDLAVREIRRASSRVAASMVPLARMAAVCLAGTTAPHQEAAGMRRDVALFIASIDDEARTLLADISAWLAGSPQHHAHDDRPSDNIDRLHDALDTLWNLGRAPSRVDRPGERATAAGGLRGEGVLRWTEWASSDVEELVEVLREHEDAVREWHRTVGTPGFYAGPDTPDGGEEGDGDRAAAPEP